jgi:hypothetical protein
MVPVNKKRRGSLCQKFLYGANDVLESSYALAGPRILGMLHD